MSQPRPPLATDEPADARAGHGPSVALPAGASRDSPARSTQVKSSVSRTPVAGAAGGATFWAATFLTFVLVGSGPLFDPARQSPKLIAVWTELQPLPRLSTAPHVVLLEYILFATGHAFLLRLVARPGRRVVGRARGGWRGDLGPLVRILRVAGTRQPARRAARPGRPGAGLLGRRGARRVAGRGVRPSVPPP